MRKSIKENSDEKAKNWNFMNTLLTLISCYNLSAFLLNLNGTPK